MADYTNYYVTKGSAVSATNGGGPRLGTNDGPTYALTAGASGATATDNGADSNIEDLNNGSWGDTQVDDVLCFDTAGTKEFAVVTAIDVGADTDIITVSPQVTASAQKGCNVCGALATIEGAYDTIPNTLTNAAGDYVRLNVKYNATAYTEALDLDQDYGGSLYVIEGYETTAGDGCPNNNLPKITSAATSGIVTAGDHHQVRNMWVDTTSGAHGMWIYGEANTFFRCRFSATTLNSVYDQGIVNHYVNCWFSAAHASKYLFQATLTARLVGCLFSGVCTQAARVPDFSNITRCLFIGNGTSANGIYMTFGAVTVTGNTVYNYAGDGIVVSQSNADTGSIVIGNVLVSNGGDGVGVNGTQTQSAFLDYNSYYDNGAEVDANITRGDHDVTLSGDPFTSAGTDFTLDNTAGQGAACRNVMQIPGLFLDGNTESFDDIGAARHEDPAGGGVSFIASRRNTLIGR